MTKPREKTREELTAEIEEGKKKIRQFENWEKIIKQKLSVEERKARNHRLCKRGGFMESLVPELIAMPDEDAKAFLRLALDERASTGVLKNEQCCERGVTRNKGALIHPLRACAPRSYLRTGTFPRLDMAAFAATRAALCAYAAISDTTKQYTRPGICTILRVLLSYPGGDTHSHLPL